MPTVPYPDQPRVQPSGLPSVRVSGNAPVEAFGGGAAVPTNAAAPLSEMARIAQEATDHANQVAFTGAAAALTDAKTALLYHPQSGVLNQRGENALSTPEQAQAGWQAAVDQIQSGLTSPVQKAAFAKYAMNDWSQVNVDVQRHVAQQRVVVDTEKTNGLNSALTQEAVNVAAKGVMSDDPTVRFQALAKATANAQQVADNTQAYAMRQGLPKEAVTEQVAKAVSGFHSQVLGAMATDPNANWIEFTDYYERHKEQLVGAQREEMSRLVANNASIGAAQQASDAILEGKPIPVHAQLDVAVNEAGTDITIDPWEPSQAPPPLAGVSGEGAQGVPQGVPQGTPQGVPGKLPTLTEARAQVANSNASPKQKKMMLQMIDQEFAKRDAAKRDQAQAVSSQFTTMLDHGVPLANVMKRPEFDLLPTETKSAIKSYADKAATGGRSDEQGLTNFYNLRMMAATNPSAYKQEVLTNYLGKVSKGQFTELAGLQAGLVSGEVSATGIRSNETTVDDALRSVGIVSTRDKTPANEKEKALNTQYNNLRSAIDADVQTWEQNHGNKKIDAASLRSITNEYTREYVIREATVPMIAPMVIGSFVTPAIGGRPAVTKKLYEMAPTETPLASITRIPAADRAAIMADLKRQGMPVTDQSVVASYQAYHKNKRSQFGTP